MKTLFLILAALMLGGSHVARAAGELAFFTGNQKQATTITGAIGWNCEYDYNGQKFWLFFMGSCPNAVVNQD